MLAIETDLLTQCVALSFHSFIISLLLKILGVKMVLAAKIHQLLQLHSQSFGRRRFGACVALVFEGDMKMVATIEFEKGMARAGVYRVVISKLCYQ